MIRSTTTTVTRPDRDRLLDLMGARAIALGWALFADELRREIDRARVVDRARVSPDVVTMHSTVRTRDLGTGRVEVHTLVYPDEADLRFGKLSVLAPLGTALLGTRAGDVARVATWDGVRALEVDAVLYQPEAAERRGGRLPSRGAAAPGTAGESLHGQSPRAVAAGGMRPRRGARRPPDDGGSAAGGTSLGPAGADRRASRGHAPGLRRRAGSGEGPRLRRHRHPSRRSHAARGGAPAPPPARPNAPADRRCQRSVPER